LIRAARRIENLPGQAVGISGQALVKKFERQKIARQLELINEHISVIEQAKQGFVLRMADDVKIYASTVNAALGTRPRSFTVAGAKAWQDARKMHRDICSLPQDIKGQQMMVVGGGDATFDSALHLNDRFAQVLIVMRASHSRASAHLQQAVEQTKIKIMTNSHLMSLSKPGSDCEIENSQGERQIIKAEHVLICIGRRVQTDIFQALPRAAKLDSIKVEKWPGLFIAGDIRRQHDRFIAAAQGDGQLAACMARDYLNERKQIKRVFRF